MVLTNTKQTPRFTMRICPLLLAPFVGFWYTLIKALSSDGRRSATPLRKGVIAIVEKLFRLCVCAAFMLYILTIYAK